MIENLIIGGSAFVGAALGTWFGYLSLEYFRFGYLRFRGKIFHPKYGIYPAEVPFTQGMGLNPGQSADVSGEIERQMNEARGLEGYTCTYCRRTSYHPEDVKEKYCGYCHRSQQPAH